MRDRAGVENALALASEARSQVVGADEPGGMMIFPEAKQHFYASTAHLWLGEERNIIQAERDAAAAVDLYEQDPPEQRRLGELNLARLDLAAARLSLGHLDATAAEVRNVIHVAGRRPTDSVAKRLRQVAAVLDRQQYHGNRAATELRDEITAFASAASVPAITSAVR